MANFVFFHDHESEYAVAVNPAHIISFEDQLAPAGYTQDDDGNALPNGEVVRELVILTTAREDGQHLTYKVRGDTQIERVVAELSSGESKAVGTSSPEKAAPTGPDWWESVPGGIVKPAN